MQDSASKEPRSTSLAHRFHQNLAALEFASPSKLAAMQSQVLADLISHVAAHISFYRKRLATVVDEGGTAVLENWQDVPVLTRDDAARHAHELRAQSVPKPHGRIGRHHSSGSRGAPLAFYRSELADLANTCAQYRHAGAAGVDWTKDLAIIRAFDPALHRFRRREPSDEPPRRESWGPPWLTQASPGAVHHLSVFATYPRQLDWLRDLGEVYLNTFPSNALALARHVKKSGAAPPKLVAIFTTGEPITPDIRREVESAFGCACFDLIATAGLGIVACECPSHQGYHVQSELVRLELLDDRDRPVKEGEWGRVIATSLYNFAMPLIRFDTGDVARLKGPCSCGRPHPLIDAVYGRPANLLRLEDGWSRPDLSTAEIEKHLPDCRWQFVHTSAKHGELRFMRFPANRALDLAEAKLYVEAVGGMPVDLREIAALGPGANGTFCAFVSESR